jgi:uncharacterized YccA/Bax inhibitor family protein
MANRNPALREKIFVQDEPLAAVGERMSIHGTARKALILLVIAFATASYPWSKVLAGEDVTALFYLGMFGGLVMAIATIFKPNWAGITAPLYAAVEGLFLGAISGFFEEAYPGIALQAVAATFAVFLGMLTLYAARIIRVTDKFRRFVIGATLGIFLLYMITFLLSIFGVNMPYLHESSTVGIIISLVIIGVAALNLALDFDFIERGSKAGAPRVLEWYGAFGLMVTLVWLYIEILRLLAILQGRD